MEEQPNPAEQEPQGPGPEMTPAPESPAPEQPQSAQPEAANPAPAEPEPPSAGVPQEGSDSEALAAAMAAEAVDAESAGADLTAAGLTNVQLPEGPTPVQPAEFASLPPAAQAARKSANIDLLLDVNLPVSIELGRTRMSINDILELGSGSIVELDKLAGEPVDILVNNKPLAKGEVVVLDENFGVRITSLVSPRERLERLKLT